MERGSSYSKRTAGVGGKLFVAFWNRTNVLIAMLVVDHGFSLQIDP